MATSKNKTKKKTASPKGRGTGGSKTRAGSSRQSAPRAAVKRTGAKAGSSGTSRSAAPKQKEYIDYAVQSEIALWIILAVCVLLFLSVVGMGGPVGRALSSVCFGLFGVMAYVLPFVIFFLSAFLISNARSRIARIKALGIFLLLLVLCGFMQMILVGYRQGYLLREYYEASAQYHIGGGLIGGALSAFFCPAIGVVGTYLILLIMAIICLVLITQRAILPSVGQKSRQAMDHAKSERGRRRQEMRDARERALLAKQQAAPDRERVRDQEAPVTFSILPKEQPVKLRSRQQALPVSVTDWESEDPFEALSTAAKDHVFQTMKSPGARKAGAKKTKKASGEQPRGKEDTNYIDLERALDERMSVGALTGPLDDIVFGGNVISEKEEKPEPIELAPKDAAPEKKAPESAAEPSRENAQSEPVSEEAQQAAERAKTRKTHASSEEIAQGISNVQAEIEASQAQEKPAYAFPPLSLLKIPPKGKGGTSQAQLRETAARLARVFETFGVHVRITNVTCGPSVTRYELTPEMGVKVSKIVSLQDDIMLNLAASDIRIEAPIPGKAAVGIEVPNKESTGVLLRELLEADSFRNHASNLAYVVGKDIAGNIIVSDIAKMPHLLIAGATGSGKSVFINTLIMSILYKASPDDVKLIMIDPKVVELSVYNGIPHLYIPVVTDPKKAAGALNWAVAEMDQRYKKFAEIGVRDLKGYNKRVEALSEVEDPDKPQKMPQIVIIVDELADLMMVSSSEVEQAICRLAQLARACGIHLVIATQRPSVDVITGLIKANMPSRIAFSVSSGVDSRTILDMNGAERLLGNGDMLFAPQTFKQPLRVQGAFVSDAEVAEIVGFLKEQSAIGHYDAQMEERLEQVQQSAAAAGGGDVDELFADAGKFIIEKDKASIGMLQRWFKIGFNRAARIMDQLSEAGVVGPEEGTKPRKVLMSSEQFENYLEQN